MTTYHFVRTNKVTDNDGKEIDRFLNDGNPLSTAGTGTYNLAGMIGGPGRLGPLPSGASHILNSDGSISLKLP